MPKSKGKLSRKGKGAMHIQIVYSEKRRVVKEFYISPKGLRLIKEGKLTKAQAKEKYGKTRYKINLKAKPIKAISHHCFN